MTVGAVGNQAANPSEPDEPLMSQTDLSATIDAAWEDRAQVTPATRGAVREAVEEALDLLDSGRARVAEKAGGEWIVHQWLKKAVLLSFRLNDMAIIPGGPGEAVWWDKVPSKFDGWAETEFRAAGFRAVPNCVVRRGAYIAPNVVLMPSFVNLGAYVDEGTMVDTWATVGSCAQIGRNVHLSGGVGIGGVLEPLQANPTIIEDNCFIGARSEVVEGVVVGEGSVLSMGVFISASTKIVDRATGEVFIGRVPPYSVVVPGRAARQAAAGRIARPVAGLRGDREAGRCADPRQDRRSTSCCGTDRPDPDRRHVIDRSPSRSPKPSSACPSVTPEEGGALAFSRGVLGDAGFAVHRPVFSGPGTPDVENLYARSGHAASPACSSPATPTWFRRAIARGWTARSVRRRWSRTASSTAAARPT